MPSLLASSSFLSHIGDNRSDMTSHRDDMRPDQPSSAPSAPRRERQRQAFRRRRAVTAEDNDLDRLPFRAAYQPRERLEVLVVRRVDVSEAEDLIACFETLQERMSEGEMRTKPVRLGGDEDGATDTTRKATYSFSRRTFLIHALHQRKRFR
jgi:hypothetical protein